jgi:hypothetical protein
VHACEVLAYHEVHAHEEHAHEVYAYEVYAHDVMDDETSATYGNRSRRPWRGRSANVPAMADVPSRYSGCSGCAFPP